MTDYSPTENPIPNIQREMNDTGLPTPKEQLNKVIANHPELTKIVGGKTPVDSVEGLPGAIVLRAGLREVEEGLSKKAPVQFPNEV